MKNRNYFTEKSKINAKRKRFTKNLFKFKIFKFDSKNKIMLKLKFN